MSFIHIIFGVYGGTAPAGVTTTVTPDPASCIALTVNPTVRFTSDDNVISSGNPPEDFVRDARITARARRNFDILKAFNPVNAQEVDIGNTSIWVDADYTANDFKNIFGDPVSAGADVTITLPPLASVPLGRTYMIKNVDPSSGLNSVIIDPNASEQIDGSATSVTLSVLEYRTLIAADIDGAGGREWNVISSS
jgi:hypothetical protein